MPVRIFNPFCRGGVASAKCPATGTGSIATGGVFTGAIIPPTHPAANPAGFGLLGAWPTQTIGGPIAGNENNEPNAAATGPIVDQADMFTSRATTSSRDTWSMSGLYIYNKTDEPGSTIMRPEEWYIASQENFFGPLRRRPHVFVLNNTNILNDSTVLTLRYGFSTWQDSCDSSRISAGIGALGFSSSYVSPVSEQDIFPRSNFDDVADVGGWGGGPGALEQPVHDQRDPVEALGQPQPQGRRRPAAAERRARDRERDDRNIHFDSLFTSNNGVGGHELASVLLGRAGDGPGPVQPKGIGSPSTTAPTSRTTGA